MKRVAEMILGIIGSLFAFGSGFFGMAFGAVDKAVNGSSSVGGLGVSAFIFAIIALIASIIVNWKPRFMGIVLVICGIGVLVSVSLFGVIPALFLVIAGLMGIFRKTKQKAETI
jgi:hypothetical protein